MAEIFDIYDEQGRPIGTAERSETHAKGYWHKTVHCWLARKEVRSDTGEETAYVLFQQRSSGKDTNPGSFDITAAGHLSAGETPEAIVRELEEELGLDVAFSELREYGVVRETGSGIVGGVAYVDNEVSTVFGLVTDRRPAGFRLQEEEVAGLYEASADELIALMEGRADGVLARGSALRGGKLQDAEATVSCSSFVERDRGYYIGVFKFLRELALGSARDL